MGLICLEHPIARIHSYEHCRPIGKRYGTLLDAFEVTKLFRSRKHSRNLNSNAASVYRYSKTFSVNVDIDLKHDHDQILNIHVLYMCMWWLEYWCGHDLKLLMIRWAVPVPVNIDHDRGQLVMVRRYLHHAYWKGKLHFRDELSFFGYKSRHACLPVLLKPRIHDLGKSQARQQKAVGLELKGV